MDIGKTRLHAMRIGIVISDQGPEAGGGFTFEQSVVSALIQQSLKTPHKLIFVGDSQEKPAWVGDLDWAALKSPKQPRKSKIRREITRIARQLVPSRKRGKPIVFDFDRYQNVREAALELTFHIHPYASPILDIPYILNVWDLAHRTLPFFPEVNLGGVWEFRERQCRERMQRAAYVVCPNASSAAEVTNCYQVPTSRIRTLHHPTPHDALEYADSATVTELPKELNLASDFLLYPAQFWPHKNHMVLLRMLQLLRTKYNYEPHLVLTGSDKQIFWSAAEGNLDFVRQRVREMGLEKQVIFAGFVPRKVLLELYRHAFALVFPSFFGPENLPPLEAFALGCPVVTGAVSGARDQYGDACFQVEPGSPEKWADAVHELRQNPGTCETLIARGRKRAREFTADDFARGLFQVFDEFEAYRCNWTPDVAAVPIQSKWSPLRPPVWENRYLS